jgi:hypothetical protein
MTDRELQEERLENDMLDKLSQLARGFDHFGQPIPRGDMLAAQAQYHALKDKVDHRRLERERLAQDKSIEEARIATQKELEHRKLDIEEERLVVQKAEVIVKALQVAAESGVDPRELLASIQGLSRNLLPERDLRLIEKKS